MSEIRHLYVSTALSIKEMGYMSSKLRFVKEAVNLEESPLSGVKEKKGGGSGRRSYPRAASMRDHILNFPGLPS